MYCINSPLIQPATHFYVPHTLIQAFSKGLNTLSNWKFTRLQDYLKMLEFSSKTNKVDKASFDILGYLSCTHII